MQKIKFNKIPLISISLFLIMIPQVGLSFSNLNEQISWFQQLFGNPTSSTQITKTDYNSGETRPKAVLKGVFYFGGSDRKRDLLSQNFKQMLCEDGFSKVYSVYIKVNENVSCNGNQYSYTHIGEANSPVKSGDRTYELLSRIYNIIQSNGQIPAIYLHCHYGVHASNTIAQMVLMQFCGISKEEAKDNWDTVDIYNSLGSAGTAKQMKKIDNFSRFPEFEISNSQRSAVCF